MKTLIAIFIFSTVFCLKLQSQWVEQTVPSGTGALYSVYAYSSNIAWACGEDSTVLLTTNAGNTWVRRGSPLFGPNAFIYGITALDANSAICVLNRNGIASVYKTTNLGTSWFRTFTRNGLYLNDIEFLNPVTGYAYGDPYQGRWFIMKTTNAGASFDTNITFRPPAGSQGDIGFPNALTLYQANVNSPIFLWFGTSSGRIYRSLNSGILWDSNLTTTNQDIYTIAFQNGVTGFAGGNSLAFRTQNSGGLWNIYSMINLGDYKSFNFVNGLVFCTTGEGICVSPNNGNTFILNYTQPNNNEYNHASFVISPNDHLLTTVNGWAVTDNGTISHYEEGIGISQISTELPSKFSLSQNYPNPFNPATIIQFEIPKEDFITLEVFDALGSKIETLHSGKLKAGKYKADFDAGSLSSGIYFYRLHGSDFTSTRKMMLVK